MGSLVLPSEIVSPMPAAVPIVSLGIFVSPMPTSTVPGISSPGPTAVSPICSVGSVASSPTFIDFFAHPARSPGTSIKISAIK